MSEEIWKDIAGYEGKYQVSNFGRVKSLNYNRTGNEQIRKPDKVCGYLRVGLWKDGKEDKQFIHRLVLEAFVPNLDNLPEVNHKDENPENNRLDNLEWISHKDNIKYGTRNERVAKKLSKPVLCVETGIVYSSSMEAERQSGVNQSHIIQCCKWKRKTTGGCHWRYTY